MMSTAILMTAGAEQTKVPVPDGLSSHQGGRDGISFAESFDEGVAISTLSQGKSTVDDAAMALRGVKNATPVKKPDEAAGIPDGAKGKDITAQKVSTHSELKSAVAGKIIQVQGRGVTEPQEMTTAGDLEMKNVKSPAPVEGVVGDVSSGSPASGTQAAGATDENPGPHFNIAGGDQTLVLSGGRPVVQKETEAGEQVKQDASAKRTAKTQESAATPKTVQKAVGKAGNVIAVDVKPVEGSPVEDAIPITGLMVASTVAPQGEMSNSTDSFSKVVSPGTKPLTGVSLTTVDGQVRKEVASGAKASVTNTVTAGSDPVASPKTDMSPEKMPAVTIPSGSDGENKPQAARESGAALSHSVGIVPTPVMSGNTPEGLAATKLLVGDAGPHTAGLPAGSREQEGSGVVAQSMDGAPRMLMATPTSLEVGIQNGTHGWLRVRAEMTDGGVVNASVSAASSAGQEMLHRELPALTAYLQEEKVAVNAVIVHAPSVAGADTRSSSGTDGAGGQTPQRSNEGEGQHQNLRKATLNDTDETMTYRRLHGADEDGSLPLAAHAGGGSWLSVRA